MGVFMTGINHLKRLSRVIVLFYPFSFVLWVFTLPASLGRFRTELIPDYTLWSRLLPCNHNISSLVLFLAPVAYPGLSTLVVFQLCVLVFFGVCRRCRQASSACVRTFGAGRAITAAMPLDTQSLQKRARNNRSRILCSVRIMCRVRYDLWAFL